MLVSGTGTILEAMVRAGLDVALVASDRRCRGLDVAFGAGTETLLVSREEFGGFAPTFDREGFTHELTDALKSRDIDLVAMAGFGTIVTAYFHLAYPGRYQQLPDRFRLHRSPVADFDQRRRATTVCAGRKIGRGFLRGDHG